MNWAKDYYHHWDGMKGTCPVCGLNYVTDIEEDRRLHRNFHREIVTTFDPTPNAALKRRRATIGEDFLLVNWADPKWLHRRLYLIARMLMRENGYDFPMWNESGSESGGFLIVDLEGRALGGFAVGHDRRSMTLRGLDRAAASGPARRAGQDRSPIDRRGPISARSQRTQTFALARCGGRGLCQRRGG